MEARLTRRPCGSSACPLLSAAQRSPRPSDCSGLVRLLLRRVLNCPRGTAASTQQTSPLHEPERPPRPARPIYILPRPCGLVIERACLRQHLDIHPATRPVVVRSQISTTQSRRSNNVQGQRAGKTDCLDRSALPPQCLKTLVPMESRCVSVRRLCWKSMFRPFRTRLSRASGRRLPK